MSPNTVRLHRVLRTTPAKIYRAFLDADAMARFLPPDGYTGRVHSLEARVGGGYRMSFTNFGNGHGHDFGGTYTELLPNQRIRYTTKFDDPNLPGEMLVTIELKAVPSGCELHIVQEGLPAVIPLDGCTVGWQQTLLHLAALVEPEIPG